MLSLLEEDCLELVDILQHQTTRKITTKQVRHQQNSLKKITTYSLVEGSRFWQKKKKDHSKSHAIFTQDSMVSQSQNSKHLIGEKYKWKDV